jgi:homoserine O-acetyltransferase/O-succinyltransferase
MMMIQADGNRLKNLVRFACLSLLVACFPGIVEAQELQLASLGDFKLQSGELIRDCVIGYRTFGKLNNERSNAILVTSWASGTSEQLQSDIGAGKLLDSAKYYVIAVDALGNGVSSSPSNSRLQPRMRFPRFTLRDTVNTQHELLTRVLRLNHLKAVMGVSMGGMQTFQWLVSYPDFMDQAIPIVGSPRLAPYDLVLWQAQLDAILRDAAWNNGNYTDNPGRVADAEFGALVLTTPENYNKHTTRKQVFDDLEKANRTPGFDANNKIRQVQAMISLDVSATFAGSMERAARTVKARLLVIVSKTDHVVTPGPAMEFANLLHSELLVLDSDCGHQAQSCEYERVRQAVAAFLDR